MGLWNTTFGGAPFEGGELPDFTVELDPIAPTGPEVFDAGGLNNVDQYVYRFEDNSSNEHVFRWTRPETHDDLTDTDQLLLFYCAGEGPSTHRVGALFTRYSGSFGNENGYSVNVDQNEIFLEEETASVLTNIATVSLPFNVVLNTWYYIQYRNIGDRHQARCWPLGTVPPNWQIDTTDSTHTAAGWTGPGCRASIFQWFDWYSLATEGDYPMMFEAVPATGIDNENTLTAIPAQVPADGTSLLVYVGEPNRAVDWGLTGDGSLSVITDYTDDAGRAYARYNPGTEGVKVIDVTVGTP